MHADMKTCLLLMLIAIGTPVASSNQTNQSCYVVQMNTDTVTANNETTDENSWACFTFDTDGSVEHIYQLSTQDISEHILLELGWLRAVLPVAKARLGPDNATLLYNHSDSDLDLVALLNDMPRDPNIGFPQDDLENLY